MLRRPFLLLMSALLIVGGCQKKKSTIAWQNDMPIIGSQSSPRACDLNDDGVLDIVMGAGKNEFQTSDKGVLAIDGKTGSLLWQQESSDQVYGSATFLDITGDGIKDVFIGGRSPHFKALDGSTGKVLWEYDHQQYATDSIVRYARYNFNNSVLVPDQNNDGLQDLLTVNGGNASAAPSSETDRYPGVLMIFDSKSGSILAADTMPDGKESYMSPLFFIQEETGDSLIVFGSGGETIDGNLYVASISDLRNKKLANARIVASERGHGFIAPPVLVDISNDGYYDIIAITHGSTVFAIDGKSFTIRWQQKIQNTECSNSFAVGNFTDDDTPDLFTFVSKGQWPNSTGTLQVMLEGKTGKIEYLDSIGCTGFSSPVVYDLDSDGYDEAIISVNEFDCSLGFAGKTPATVENRLIAVFFRSNYVRVIDQTPGFKNIFSTPWLGDIDDDGYIDIVHCQYFHYGDLLSFLGMSVRRIDTPIKVNGPVLWGSYMGSNGNGLYPSSR